MSDKYEIIAQNCLALAIDRCKTAGLPLQPQRQRLIIKGAIRQMLEESRMVETDDDLIRRANALTRRVQELERQLEVTGRTAAALQAYYEDGGVEICMTCRHEKYYADSSGVSFSGGWQCEPDWWVRECQHPDPEARAQVDEIYDALFPDGGTKYGVHIPPVTGCQWWEADDDPERLLLDLTPGGSEFSGSPEACAAWVRERLASTGRLAAERNRMRTALEFYAYPPPNAKRAADFYVADGGHKARRALEASDG